jgi:ATP-binding cassette, subfamily B, bacterial
MKGNREHRALPVIAASLRLGWESSPGRLTAIALLSIAGAVVIVVAIAAQKGIVDAVESYIGLMSVISVPISFILFRFLLQITGDLLAVIKGQIIGLYSTDLENRLMERCAKKAARIDLIHYEDAELYNQLEKARQGGESVAGVALTVIALMTSLFSTLVGVTGYLMYLNPTFAFILLFSLVPSLVVRLILARIRAGVVDETAAARRSLAYAADCIASREYFKETRTLGAFSFFISRWETSRSDVDRTEWRYYSRDLLLRSLEWICLYLGYALSFLLAARSLFTGEISIGAFAAVLAALAYVQSSAGAIVSDLGDTFVTGTIANTYFQFLDLPEKPRGDGHREESCAIYLERVSFKYPSAEGFCLTDIDLTIHPGETLAIVGANGAGKTTLSKVVIGLLTPQIGRVLCGKVEMGDIPEDRLFLPQSAVFQDFGKYKMTLRENVALGNIAGMEDDRRVERCLLRAGLDLTKAEYREKGIDTLIAPDYGGIDISGGEWQLVALARSYFRDHSFVVLDEPTSSIDPIREAEIYEQFMGFAQDKTALIITHRLGAATLADRIVLMDSGRIQEMGTHRQLMSMDGLYATMFRAQAKWYRRGDIEEGN